MRRLIRPAREEAVYSHTLGRRDPNIWAVRDLDFEVHRGAGLGIIGPDPLVPETDFLVKDGHVRPPSGSGLGVTVDERALETHTLLKEIVQ